MKTMALKFNFLSIPILKGVFSPSKKIAIAKTTSIEKAESGKE